jgi:hypothetical protein
MGRFAARGGCMRWSGSWPAAVLSGRAASAVIVNWDALQAAGEGHVPARTSTPTVPLGRAFADGDRFLNAVPGHPRG